VSTTIYDDLWVLEQIPEFNANDYIYKKYYNSEVVKQFQLDGKLDFFLCN
jgi:hypothetical protein